MIKSLRLRLQLFHAIILTIAVVVFGATFYRQLHRSTMGEIDADLLSGARVLEGTLRGMPPASPGDRIWRLPLELPPATNRHRPPPPGTQRDGTPRDGGPLDQERRPGSSNPQRELSRELPINMGDGPNRRPESGARANMSPAAIDGPPNPRGNEPQRPGPPTSPPYFAIFADEGKLLRAEPENIDVAWTPMRRPLEYRNIGERREVLLRGPRRLLIIVGRDVSPEKQRLSAALVQLVLIGSGVLCLGLLGGWWLSGNAVRPIQHITRTAQGITARNLAERIDTASMDHELQSLGTTLNSMLARIESAFEKQCQFTADASHDLRTPLAVLLSHCELALSRPRSSEEYQSTLCTCQAAAVRMKSLVDGLLLLARSDAGELDLERAEVDLKQLANEAVELFKPYAAERNVELKLIGDAAPCIVDSDAISQVIANLLDNAILYNRKGGLVTLTTSNAAGMACLQIQDTGSGIPADALARIFDRFYRVDEARSLQTARTGQSGSGLGLSICKTIVEAHGGRLNVTSQIDVGSSFELQLPTIIDSQDDA